MIPIDEIKRKGRLRGKIISNIDIMLYGVNRDNVIASMNNSNIDEFIEFLQQSNQENNERIKILQEIKTKL